MVQADAEPGAGQQAAPRLQRADRLQRGLALAIALLVAKRLAYHLTYLVGDPFALATFSDGHVYELAARDIVAHPPLGSEPFYLQGLYAYLLALPLAITDEVVIGLLIQLVLAAGALWLLHRTAVSVFGATAGALSTLVLLGYHELAFYENKYLSVSLGATCNALALWAAVRCLQRPSTGALVGAGAAAGLAVLGRPNLAVALPFTAAALCLGARSAERPAMRTLLAYSVGVLLALAPMALRNQLVIGRPDVQPSHSGGIPFYIGNNPSANGRWNTAGGLISGQVGRERVELAQHLGLAVQDGAELDRAVGDAMRDEALRFIREHPGDWLALELKKLWLTLGNHRFVRDYDARGEAELIGGFWSAVALPFGVLLGLGAVGLHAIFRRALRVRGERAQWLGLLLVLGGQLIAVLSANLLIFTSAQNRLPLCIPLAFAAGPGLLALWALARRLPHPVWQARPAALAASALFALQAFVPRSQQADRPTSVHYYNLAAVEEALGRLEPAAEHYRRAAERNPKQPMFHLSRARVLRRLGHKAQAQAALHQLARLPDLPEAVRKAASDEQRLLQGAKER
jgi:tetratricopeptide (TPR) repeat protein